MNLNAPTQLVFFISLALAALALLSALDVAIPVVQGNAIWVALGAYAVLAASNIFKGL